MRSKKIIFCLLLIGMMILGGAEKGACVTYVGSLTGGGGGIDATAQWNSTSTTFAWTVKDVGAVGGSILWQYDYTFTVPDKNISHLLLEVTDPAAFTDFRVLTLSPSNDSPKNFTPGDGNSNPNMPGNLYGLKYEVTNTNTYTFSFTTLRSPVWGDFYAKDGKSGGPGGGIDVTAWNTGFLNTDPLDAPKDGSVDYHILRPDGYTPVPIPAAFWLLGTGLLGLVWLRRKFPK